MLVLTRTEGEEIVIYDKETKKELGRIRVCSVKGPRVRIGIRFPDSVGVDREEVYKSQDRRTSK